jgi:hypothetical protein
VRNRVPPTTYGVVSKLPVSASRMPSVDVSVLAVVTRACVVACTDGSVLAGVP